MNSIYFPVFRARQQEILVLRSFPFETQMTPIIEVIKEKDRLNNTKSTQEIYLELIEDINSKFVLLDLPIYLRPTTSTMDETIKFYRKVISNLSERIKFFSTLRSSPAKTIPVISSLLTVTGETDTTLKQANALKSLFPILAFRIFFNNFNDTFNEFVSAGIRDEDIIMLDLDTIPITNPIIKKYSNLISTNFPNNHKVLIRSAISTDILNINLTHNDVIGEADNSLINFYKSYKFNSFGDYVGIKKDEIPAGGGISPGFIMYDPLDNVYYGYKGNIKKLSEFEDTIVPDVLNSNVIKNIISTHKSYLDNNPGYETILRISTNSEPGKSQAKFKKISMEHYLYCIKINILEGLLS